MWKQVLGGIVSRKWTMGHMSYSTEYLQTIRKQAFSSSNYSLFSINQGTRAWIISLVIRKQATKKLYRCSRGGRNLFNRIEKIISTTREGKVIIKDRTTTLSVINMNLRPKQISLSLVNARSIVNKTVPFQQYITEKGHRYKHHNRNMDKNGGRSKFH